LVRINQPDWLKHFEMWSGDKLGLPVFSSDHYIDLGHCAFAVGSGSLGEFIIWIEREK